MPTSDTQPARILVVDDHPTNVKALRMFLQAEGHQVLEASNGVDAVDSVRENSPDLVLLDIMMPRMDGYEAFGRIKQMQDGDFVPVIMVTAKTETESLVKALEAGADEYVTKPFEPLELMARVKSMLRIRRMDQECCSLKEEIAAQHRFDDVIGRSAAMQRLFAVLDKIVASDVTILLTGESGTGKETIARCVHYNGPRSVGRFVAVNCGALAENLLESELFGHRKGSFTGATEDRVGLFESASGGTVFLDEIGETSPGMQVKLLRVLQEAEITRVGESEPRQTDARVIAATNRDLQEEITAGRFRQDLYYRLSVFPVELPPVRERREDIPLLAQHFLTQHAERSGRAAPRLAPAALEALSQYTWPGNVRELENETERALVLTSAGQDIELEALSEKVSDKGPRRRRRSGSLPDAVRELEGEMIEDAQTTFGGNKTRMSEHLGISRWTLLQKMRNHGLEPPA